MTKDTKTFDLANTVQEYKVGPRDVDAPFVTDEEEAALAAFYGSNPSVKQNPLGSLTVENTRGEYTEEEPWIQTYSGIRFNPTNPVVGSIVIGDIAHALSMQCRFSGHVKKFYSVAQHCVLVSYLCDKADAMWGLLHDASETYLVDIPRPLKHSGKLEGYKEFEAQMQVAICERFGLPFKEPKSVKDADNMLLVAEARDLMGPLHPTWINFVDPPPFHIDPISQQDAKNLFMKRFYELSGRPEMYSYYLDKENYK